jgi:hypothetical protein
MTVRKKTVPLTANNLTRGIKNHIKVMGGWAVRVNTMGVYDQENKVYRRIAEDDKGVSDVVGCICGRAIFVEVKVGADKESKYQKRFKKEMQNAGAVCIIAKNMNQFINDLDEALDYVSQHTKQ